MYTQTNRNWTVFWIGVCLLVIGTIMCFIPGLDLMTAAIVFGILLCALGVGTIIGYAAYGYRDRLTGWTLAAGIIDLILGFLFLVNPLVSGTIIPFLLAIYLVAYGIVQFFIAARMSNLRQAGYGWYIYGGIVAILVGILFLFAPGWFPIFLLVYLMARGIALMIAGASGETNDTTDSRHPYGV